MTGRASGIGAASAIAACAQLFAASAVLAQTGVPPGLLEAAPENAVHAYIATTGSRPAGLVERNALALLYLAANPTTAEDLDEAGLTVSPSLVTELESAGLVRRDSLGNTSGIPVLDSARTIAVRHEAQNMATALADDLGPSPANLKEELRPIDWEPWAFSIAFSLGLDDLVWRELEALGVLVTGAGEFSRVHA